MNTSYNRKIKIDSTKLYKSINNIKYQNCGPYITLNTASKTRDNNFKSLKNPFLYLYMQIKKNKTVNIQNELPIYIISASN